VLLYETARGSRWVSACSAEAKSLRIAPGMPLAEATAMAGSKELAIKAHDRAADRQSLEQLAFWCGRFSPLVGIEDSQASESLLLDITGIGHLFGGERSLMISVHRDLVRRGLDARLSVADTLGAAWAVARFDAGAAGFRLVPSGETFAALRGLPVEALRLSGETLDLLHQLGIHYLGQLEPLPRCDLTARFGPELIKRLDQATGRLPEPVPALPLPPEFEASQSLEPPSSRREIVEFMLEQLVERLTDKLACGGRGALRMECRLDCGRGGKVDLEVGLFRPTASTRHLLGLMRMKLERAKLCAPVESIRVWASVTDLLERRQQEFFPEPLGRENPRQLAALVDRLSSRLGAAGVLRPHLQSDAQPEWAYRYEPLIEHARNRRTRRVRPQREERLDLPPRPLRLYRRPVPLPAMSVQPDGPPVRFRYQAREHRIATATGPERIETGWWRGRTVRRDYYRVETASGHRYWLFRNLPDGQWFLHGAFE
jgi:protein ImuB